MRDSPPQEEREGKRRTSWFLVVIVGLIAAAVGVGAGYVLFAQDSGGGTNDAVEALLDDFYAAMNTGDVEALQEMSMEGATILGVPVESGSILSRSLENSIPIGGLARVDDPIVDEQGWIFHVAQLTDNNPDNDEDDVIWLFTMEDSGSVNLGGDGTEQELKIMSVEPFVR